MAPGLCFLKIDPATRDYELVVQGLFSSHMADLRGDSNTNFLANLGE